MSTIDIRGHRIGITEKRTCHYIAHVLYNDGMGWTIKYYTDCYGTFPVRDFIDSISPEAQAKFIFIADLLEEYGIGVKELYVKSISGQKKLFEIRIKDRANIHRIFYFTNHWSCFTASQKRQIKPLGERSRLP